MEKESFTRRREGAKGLAGTLALPRGERFAGGAERDGAARVRGCGIGGHWAWFSCWAHVFLDFGSATSHQPMLVCNHSLNVEYFFMCVNEGFLLWISFCS